MLCFQSSVAPVQINVQVEKRLLENDGWLKDNQLTTKAKNFIDSTESSFSFKRKKMEKASLGIDAAEKIEKYREIFPKGMLPSGVPGRLSVRELTGRFVTFFTDYPEYADWDLILKVTQKYVERFESENYKGMRNSGYFVYKTDSVTKATFSDLATHCGLYLEDDQEEPTFQIKLK